MEGNASQKLFPVCRPRLMFKLFSAFGMKSCLKAPIPIN